MIETLEARGPFPFVTRRLVRAPDGSVVAWESRRHRKHENVLDTRRGSTWWRPDAFGSICFLVASALAWGEVGHRWWSWRPHDLGGVIAALNLLGSIAFGVSAVAAKIVDDGPRSPELTNLGTLVGALCFLAGAILLLPERTADQVGSGNTAAS